MSDTQTATATSTANKMPAWIKPDGIPTEINVLNSLTGKKEPFIIADRDTRTITWYTCGPTVYDKSHLGHARSYVGFDILRRIVEDYFQYSVMYIINVTDVDDKIIRKANRVLLGDVLLDAQQYKHKASASLQELLQSTLDKIDFDDKTKDRAKQLTNAQLVEVTRTLKEAAWSEGALSKDVYEREAGYVAIARHNEDLFWKDMTDLQVRQPTVITRVTEYVPEIVAYVQKIIENGYAYENNGSVYFDTVRFASKCSSNGDDSHANGSGCSAVKHVYGKLEPWSVGNQELAAEGEGEWAKQQAGSEKRSANDFALWKRSKEGEPAWDSPWGKGRPGWHIECSAMASHVVSGKSTLDVHCGGIDLRFPHHDNELAQSEAHFECEQWVHYFLHTGHLHIDGMTMSKSKKNFITIREALDEFKYNSRQIRMLFLMRRFNDKMDFSRDAMEIAINKERFFNEFFQNVKAALRNQASLDRNSVLEIWGVSEFELQHKLHQIKRQVHESLCDNFDTPSVILHLTELVSATNKYLMVQQPRAPLLRDVANYITHLFRVFGLIDSDSIGFPAMGDSSSDGGANYEQSVAPFLDAFALFRDQMREAARAKKDHKEILQLSDTIRDDILPELGVRLEDRTGEKSIWKLEDKEVLRMERERARQEALERQLEKEEKQRQREEAERKKWEEAKVSPKDMFKDSTSPRYTDFDEEGIPTHFIDETTGQKEEVSKSQRKTLTKSHQKQKKLNDQYLLKFGSQ